MKYRSELTIDGYTVLNIHETPTQAMVTTTLPKGHRHPAGLTCRQCGAMFNTSASLHAHNGATHLQWVSRRRLEQE